MSDKRAVLSLISDDMVVAADVARIGYLHENPDDHTGALRAALETAMNHGIHAVEARWSRGSNDDGGMSPIPAEQFPISPFEAWYIMRGYKVAIKADFRWDDDVYLFGNIEGSRAGLMLKE